MRILLLDNRDSFVWNLVHAVHAARATGTDEVRVLRSDHTSIPEIEAARPDAVILSPGPSRPAAAGILLDAVRHLATARIPTLGVCLGHQAIGEAFGAELVVWNPVHGDVSPIEHDGTGLFATGPDNALEPVEMARYHSLGLASGSVVAPLTQNAWLAGERDRCMAIRHESLPIHGVQFHPESFLSGRPGTGLIGRFLEIATEANAA